MSEKFGAGLVFGTAVISGFSIFLNSFAVKGFDSSVFTFSKNLVVALALLALLFGTSQWKQIRLLTSRQWKQLAIIGLIGGSVPFLLFFKGLQMTTGPMGSFIHKTMFLPIAILAVLFLKEKVSKGMLLGTGLLLIGNYLLIKPGMVFSMGHLLILAATGLWAIENVYAKKVLREISGSVVAFGRMAFGSAFIFLFLLATDKAKIITSMTSAQYGWILITSVLLLLYVLTFYNGLKHVKVTSAACILALGSPITTFLAWAFQGSPLTALQFAGSIIIALGISAILLFPAPSNERN